MKTLRIIALSVALLLFGVVSAGATSIKTDADDKSYVLNGHVISIFDEGFIFETESHGMIQALINSDTHMGGMLESEKIKAGDYVYVTYNGMMTRSIPSQVVAQSVQMHILEGVVSEIMDGEILLSHVPTHGEVIVNLKQGAPVPDIGTPVRIYYDGVMTMSLPGEISAGAIMGFFTDSTENKTIEPIGTVG